MTRVDFYRYAEDKQHYACRLAAKASRSNKVVVYSPDREALNRFDNALWSFQATGFVPHVWASSPLAAETPVILASSGDDLPHHDVLLNLADEWPPFFATFGRLLEIVGADETDKELARARYVFYQKRGYDIRVNDIDAEKRQEIRG
ncbi:MAG TPA: DNA polymerase III subunit chi [Usitatibacter sp.]|nr:DNA polymerase III subunit chi [Usitatibacter sp.]